MPNAKTKNYIGDSVYAEVADDMIRLTTENGLPDDPSNEIFLEIEVFAALVGFARRHMGWEVRP